MFACLRTGSDISPPATATRVDLYSPSCGKLRGSFFVFPSDANRCVPTVYPNADRSSGGPLITCAGDGSYKLQRCTAAPSTTSRDASFCNNVDYPWIPSPQKINCSASIPSTLFRIPTFVEFCLMSAYCNILMCITAGVAIPTAKLSRYSNGYCTNSSFLDAYSVLLGSCLVDLRNPSTSMKVACTSKTTYNAQLFNNGGCAGVPDVNVTNGVGAECFYGNEAFGFQVDCKLGIVQLSSNL